MLTLRECSVSERARSSNDSWSLFPPLIITPCFAYLSQMLNQHKINPDP